MALKLKFEFLRNEERERREELKRRRDELKEEEDELRRKREEIKRQLETPLFRHIADHISSFTLRAAGFVLFSFFKSSFFRAIEAVLLRWNPLTI